MASIVNRLRRKITRVFTRQIAKFRPSLRAAIIGYGGIGPDHVRGYESNTQCRVLAVSDLRPASLGAALRQRPYLRGYRDYKQMLSEIKPDLVSICTWPQSHCEIIKQAAEAGVRGILCEKPLTLRADELDEIAAICADKGIKIAGGHQWRFHPAYQRAAEIVKSGALGNGIKIEAACQGVLADNGPHLIDSIRFILGDIRALSVRCAAYREGNAIRQGLPAEDGTECEIEFEGQIRASFSTGNKTNDYLFNVIGEKGSIIVSPEGLEVTGDIACDSFSVDSIKFINDQFLQFVKWVKGSAKSYIASFDKVAHSSEIMLALYDSARTGEQVVLPLQNRGDVINQLYPDSPVLVTQNLPETDTAPLSDRLAMDGGTRSLGKWFRARPRIGIQEAKNLAKVVISRKMNCAEGTMVSAFQEEYAEMAGASYALASSSGTAAIHCALGAFFLEPGDEVITTPLSDMGTVIPILACNCLPVFADVDPVTGNLTAKTIAEKLTPKTKAVIVVHLFGRPANMEAICELLESRNIRLIEDCAQAHYADIKGRKVGNFGDFGCFSFQQSKQISCGDGGITITSDAELADRAALFSDKGWRGISVSRPVRNHFFLGMNYRMTEFQGAVALAQTRRLPELIALRRAAATKLALLLGDVPGISLPPMIPEVTPSWWVFTFYSNENETGVSNSDLAAALDVEGVKVTTNYLAQPLFEYDVIKLQKTYGDSRYPFSQYQWDVPKSEDYPGFHAANGMLGIFWSHDVTDEHVKGIAHAIRKVMRKLSKK